MILQRTIDTVAGMYDFAVSGGAVGSYDLQVPIPKNVIVKNFVAWVITPLDGDVTSTVSFDAIATDVSPKTTAIGYYMGAQVIGGFAFVGAIICGGGIRVNATYVNGNGIPSNISLNNLSVGFSIGVLPVTAGKIGFFAEYVSFDIGI